MAKNLKSDAEIRDAAMLYLVKIRELEGEELGLLAAYIFSWHFMYAVKSIKLEMKIEDHLFYNIDALSGIARPKDEDVDTLGDHIVQLLNERIDFNRYFPNNRI